jgi:hypothetical protein
VAATSAPAAMSNATMRKWPLADASMSAVHLPQSILPHPTAAASGTRPLPDACFGGDVGAGGDEHLDHASGRWPTQM